MRDGINYYRDNFGNMSIGGCNELPHKRGGLMIG